MRKRVKKGQPGLSKGNGISGSESGRPAGYAEMSSAASKPFAESGGIDYSVQKWLLHSRGFPIDLFYLSIVVCGVGFFLFFPPSFFLMLECPLTTPYAPCFILYLSFPVPLCFTTTIYFSFVKFYY